MRNHLTVIDGRRWRHVKRGTTYIEIGRGNLQSQERPLDGEPVVIYRSEADGSFWARPTCEFEDGRFEPAGEKRPPEGDWSGDGRLSLTPAYYEDAERVFHCLMLVDAEATQEEVAGWSPEQRKLAAEWAISCHFSASDNEDVKVPPRPDFIRPRAERPNATSILDV